MKYYLVPDSTNPQKLVKIGAQGFVPPNSYPIPADIAHIDERALVVVEVTNEEIGNTETVVQVDQDLLAQVEAEKAAQEAAQAQAEAQQALMNEIIRREEVGKSIVRQFKLRNVLAPISIADTQKLFDMPAVIRLLNRLEQGSLDTALDTLNAIRADAEVMAELATITTPVIDDAYLATIAAQIQAAIGG